MFEFGASHKHDWTLNQAIRVVDFSVPGPSLQCERPPTELHPLGRDGHGNPAARHSWTRVASRFGWRLPKSRTL